MGNVGTKTAVITGGTKGVGKALADKFRREGFNVIILARHISENAEDAYSCDVSNKARVDEVFALIGEKYDRIDLLINNAGFGLSGALELTDESTVRSIVDVNLLGTIFCTQAALPYMEKGGKIINISSAAAFAPMPFRTMYSVTKAGINQFSFGMRLELRHLNIQVGAACLGTVRTDFTKHRKALKTVDPKYSAAIERADDFVDKPNAGEKKMKPEKAADIIYNYASKKRLKPLKMVGAAYGAAYFVYKLAPVSFILKIISKVFEG